MYVRICVYTWAYMWVTVYVYVRVCQRDCGVHVWYVLMCVYTWRVCIWCVCVMCMWCACVTCLCGVCVCGLDVDICVTSSGSGPVEASRLDCTYQAPLRAAGMAWSSDMAGSRDTQDTDSSFSLASVDSISLCAAFIFCCCCTQVSLCNTGSGRLLV